MVDVLLESFVAASSATPVRLRLRTLSLGRVGVISKHELG
jgi:hypothetical protein